MWKVLKRGFASRNFSQHFEALTFQPEHLCLSEEVRDALETGKGVVALESTIITHGMPFPHNFSTALSVERKVRNSGSVPATVAVLDGRLCVGLNERELLNLAEKNSKLIKISRRDLPYVLSQKLSGGTTVSGTMIAAHKAGIHVFATGGIGGVHRGAETSFDVSADLTELGRTPVAVVSSGVKSILDIPKTLEYLETQGVFVSSFGDSREFPAFFTTKSGSLAPYNTRTVYEAAQIIETQSNFGLSSGMLFAVPIPDEFSASGEAIENAVKVAVHEAQCQNVSGKAVTPFILNEVNKLTGGESLQANIALVENNARVAGGIACCLSLIQQGLSREEILSNSFIKPFSTPVSQFSDPNPSRGSSQFISSKASTKSYGRPVVIGATVMDLIIQVKAEEFETKGATYPGTVSQSFGGVGRNLADCLTRMEANPIFISAIGQDAHAASLSTACHHMDLNAVQRLDLASTAIYCPVLASRGSLLLGIGDMCINDLFTAEDISHLELTLKQAPLAILDGNYTPQLISYVVDTCHEARVPVWYEPTDVHKAAKPFESDAWKKITVTSPNLAELRVMWKALKKNLGQENKGKNGQIVSQDSKSKGEDLEDVINESLMMCRDLVPWMPVILVTLAQHGAVLCHGYGDGPVGLRELQQQTESTKFQALYFPAVTDSMEEPLIASVSGAGDCLCAATIAGILQGKDLDASMQIGMLAATFSLTSSHAVPDSINPISVSQKVAGAWGWQRGQDITNGFAVVDGSSTDSS